MSTSDAHSGIAKPARVSVSISIDTPKKSQSLFGLRPKRPVGFLKLVPNSLLSPEMLAALVAMDNSWYT